MQQPLIGGSPVPNYLLAEADTLDAIVSLEFELNLGGEIVRDFCTGSVVPRERIIFAAHCLHDTNPQAVALRGSQTASILVENPTFAVHPTADLAVLELVGTGAEGRYASLPLVFDVDALKPGYLVQLAGFGSDNAGQIGTLNFAVGSVADLTDNQVITSAGGYGGACNGDSGGPLLIRDALGRVGVAGVLSYGSVSCRGTDTHIVLAAYKNWLEEQGAATDGASTQGCEALGKQGRCFNGRSAYCENGVLMSEACGQACGWDTPQGGFRCLVSPSSDPCAGINDLGVCQDGAARRCVSGTLRTDPCALCGGYCARSPATGSATCTLSP